MLGSREQEPAKVRVVVELLDGISRVLGLVDAQAPLQLVQHLVDALRGDQVRA